MRTKAVSSWGLEMSLGPMLGFEAALIEGVGVLSRSFSEPLAGVDEVTFSGSAEEAMFKDRKLQG